MPEVKLDLSLEEYELLSDSLLQLSSIYYCNINFNVGVLPSTDIEKNKAFYNSLMSLRYVLNKQFFYN